MSGAGSIARYIDLAYLRADREMSVDGLRQMVELAIAGSFRSLCVMPALAGTVKKNYPQLTVCAVVSYPLGMDTLSAKQSECKELIGLGVDELDVVLDLFALVNDNLAKTRLEAEALTALCKDSGRLLKCIVEASLLSGTQLGEVSALLADSGVDCVKTGTGYHRPGATVEEVRTIRSAVGQRCVVKASGGIRSLADAQALLNAGADILGSSSGAAILQEEAAAT